MRVHNQNIHAVVSMPVKHATTWVEGLKLTPREKKIGLSVRALRRSEERAEMDAYLSREGDKARFSLEDVMSAELQKRVGGGDSETEN